jgi:23S rRNA pseudouridine1911/1915/1917 synthase
VKHTTLIVERGEAGQPLANWLSQRLGQPRSFALNLLRQSRVRVGGVPCPQPTRRVQPGQRIEVELPADDPPREERRPSRRAPTPSLYHVDDHVVVVDKPAGLTTVRHPEEVEEHGKRAGRFLPPTLADVLPSLLRRSPGNRSTKVRAVHRLDKETSGLLVFARTVEAERHLGQQFRARTVERTYLALVRGEAESGRIESWFVRDRGDSRRGSGSEPGVGQHAVTHVRVIESLPGFTLVECRLETGRTHQVRIHLGEAGTPLCGETVYDRPLHGKPHPDDSGAPRILLHAATLSFTHPHSGETMRWSSPMPDDMTAVLERLRQNG